MTFKDYIIEGAMPRIINTDKSQYGDHEAEYQLGKGIILYNKFYTYPKPMQKWILAHEFGHWFREENIPLSDIMGWEEGENFQILSRENSDEGFAEAFAVFFYEPNDLKKRYPEQYSRMKKYVKASLVSKIKKIIDKHINI